MIYILEGIHMNKTILALILILLCSLTACVGKRQELVSPEPQELALAEIPELVDPAIVDRDGITYLADATEPLTAHISMWNEGARLTERFTVKEGMREGLYRLLWEDGQLLREGNYLKGQYAGTWRRWYRNGQLEHERNYVNGKREGWYRTWFENGQPKIEFNFVNGEVVLRRNWNKNGQMIENGQMTER
jgi:antitoxin component YwqK of YwqJK toxin-antitoxin module